MDYRTGVLPAYCLFIFVIFVLFFAFLLELPDCKQVRHGNWKNNWTFSLVDGLGEAVGGWTLCVFEGLGWGGGGGEEQVERGGRGVKVFLGGVGGGYGGVRIAGCGWVCQCHVSSLALLASRLEGYGTKSLAEAVQLLSESKVG